MKLKTSLIFITSLLTFQLSFGQSDVIEKSVNYLSQNGKSPEEYVINTFKTKDIVLLSEDHRVKENLDFLQSLVPKLYDAGVLNIGMEFGASEDQAKLDSLVNAETYNEDVAREIMFSYNTGWAFKEYMDVYRAVWKFNKSLAKNQPKFRVVNLSYKYDWTSFDGVRTPENMKIVFHKGNSEAYRFNIVDREIVKKNQKIIILTGEVHGFTQYQFPVYDFLSKDFIRYQTADFGNLLYQKFGDKVFSILLHQPFSNYPNKKPTLVSPANGNIEKIMARLNNKKFGFDLANTPLGELRDSSYYSMGYDNFKLSDLHDGYIFLNPLNKLHSCTIDTLFLNEKNSAIAIKNMPDPDWRKRPKNLTEYWQQIYDFADIPKIYAKVDK